MAHDHFALLIWYRSNTKSKTGGPGQLTAQSSVRERNSESHLIIPSVHASSDNTIQNQLSQTDSTAQLELPSLPQLSTGSDTALENGKGAVDFEGDWPLAKMNEAN
jgi:hypothetical protein